MTVQLKTSGKGRNRKTVFKGQIEKLLGKTPPGISDPGAPAGSQKPLNSVNNGKKIHSLIEHICGKQQIKLFEIRMQRQSS